MKDDSALATLIRRARGRLLWRIALDQSLAGAAAALGGVILLLLLGTQILDWYWPALLFVAAAAMGAWRALHRRPTPYQVAQGIDRRLDLHDTLSTAYHFQQAPPNPRAAAEIIAAQRARAERIAAQLHPAAALPFRVPHFSYLVVTFGMCVAGLFFLRYGLQGRLDLRQPLVPGLAEFFGGAAETASAKLPGKQAGGQPPPGMAVQQPEAVPELDPATQQALEMIDVPEVSAESSAASAERLARGEALPVSGEERAEPGEDQASTGPAGQTDDPAARESAGASKGQEPSRKAKPPERDDSPENSSLLDKMRDAMANLLAKLKIQPPTTATRAGATAKGPSDTGTGEQMGSEKGRPGAGQEQASGSPGEEAESADQAAAGQQARPGEGRDTTKGTSQSAQSESKSGIGRQEGSKDLRDAEQQEAMGKLSEILGRRAANVTGEVMVEVTSSKHQSLRTAYSQKSAIHTEGGGASHRDEIPLAYQHYVQQYFEQVRKPEAQSGSGTRQ